MRAFNLKETQYLYACQIENGNMYVLPPQEQPDDFCGQKILWILDSEADSSRRIETEYYQVIKCEGSILVRIAEAYKETSYSGVPNCDFWGNRFEVEIGGKKEFQEAMSQFYWKSLLCECAERTFMRRDELWREGYVLSTLQLSKYAGTYPAVDHEFHIRGRMALGGAFELELIKRMMQLQIRTMVTDDTGLNRIPCSVQPSGEREYHITRKSLDGRTEARMFPYTGIIELCDEMYEYYCLTKDKDFLAENIPYLENGLRFMDKDIDENGRLWADVYYEDQVMKDGATAQAQAFAVESFGKMAWMEELLGRKAQASFYKEISDRMKANYVQTIPHGYWNEETKRYVDWIDRQGVVHDHIHLLSNALSVTYQFNKSDRDELVNKVIHDNDDIFQKFPSYVAARIEEYTEDEIGDGGPYDLCAAGRYWCHDAKYRHSLGEASTLLAQLKKVAEQAKIDEFAMGERYDMNYVYYNTGKDGEKNWHGASKYYEYPNVYLDVLLHDFFGIRSDNEADLQVVPCCTDDVSVLLESKGISYKYEGGRFVLKNIAEKPKKIRVDLSKLKKGFGQEMITLNTQEEVIYE